MYQNSDSMYPTILPGDLLIIEKSEINDVQVDDIIAFETHAEGVEVLVRRVIEAGSGTDGRFGVDTQGDDEEFHDPWTIYSDGYIGKVVEINPPMGALLSNYFQYPLVAIIVISIALLVRESIPKKGMEIEELECKRCFTPESLIITESGPRKIKDIKVGDHVLTHKGRYKPVVETMNRKYDGNVLEFSVQGINMTTILTPEHPIFKRQMTRSSSKNGGVNFLTIFEWVNSDVLYNESQRKLSSYRHRKQHIPIYPRMSEVQDIESKTFSVKYFGEDTTFEIPINHDFMKCVGYWLAEGTLNKSLTRGTHGIRYFFGKGYKEFQLAQDAANSLAKLSFHPSVRNYRGLWEVGVYNAKLGRMFEQQFGNGASKKRIPLWIKKLPSEKLDVLLHSYLKGDGHMIKKDIKWVASTVSPSMAFDIRDIALKIGYSCRFHRYHKNSHGTIMGRIVKIKPQYHIFIYTRDSLAKNTLRTDNENLYPRIKKVEKKHYSGLVYNIEVDSDNSYCTPLFAVHNCGYKWHPRVIGGKVKIPATCPAKECRSPYWQTRRKTDKQ